MNVRFVERELVIDDCTFPQEHPIQDALALGDLAIVLFDPASGVPNWQQFRNLIALDSKGEQVWTAEHPTTLATDCYYEVDSLEPLIVSSMASYVCEIDPVTGRLIRHTFTK